MPVRTAKHRASRQLWTWPLRSPRHLAATTTALAVVVLVAALTATHSAPSERSSPLPAPSSTRPSTATTPPTTTPPTTTPPTTTQAEPAPPAALRAAREFATRWTQHPPGMTRRDFHKRLRAYAHPEFLATTLPALDPTRIPDTRVTGPPSPVTVTDHRVTVAVPTNAAIHHLTLTPSSGDDTWRVHHRRVVTHP